MYVCTDVCVCVRAHIHVVTNSLRISLKILFGARAVGEGGRKVAGTPSVLFPTKSQHREVYSVNVC